MLLPLCLPHVGHLLHDVHFLHAGVLAAQLLNLLALVDVPAVGRALSDTSVLNSAGLCNGEIARATGDAKSKTQFMAPAGFDPAIMTPAEFAAFLREDRESGARLVRAANIKLD